MKIFASLVCLAAALMMGCSPKERAVDERGWPSKIVFAYTPDEEEPESKEESHRRVARYLEQQLGIDVEMKLTTQYGPVIEALRAKKVDMSSMGTFAYLIAYKKAGVEPVVARGYEDGSPREYHSVFITRSDKPWQDLEELVADARNVRFAFVNPASTSGHLLPRAALEKQGVVPEADFKELVYPGNHSATLLSTLAGQVDAAAVSDATIRKLIRLGKIGKNDFRILGESPPIPTGCIAIRSELPESLKQAVREAYLKMPIVEPELNQELLARANRFTDPEERTGNYIAIDDSRFEGLRELSGTIESLAMLR